VARGAGVPLDRLYAVPRREFVRARNALAAELRERGQPGASRAVKALRRPSAALWAVNQLARRDRVGLERLLRAVDRLRAAQLGQPTPATFPAATAEYRTVLQALVGQAAAGLRAAGEPPSPATVERIRTTLQGAAADDQARVRLRHGDLPAEVGPRGFAAFGAAPALASRPAPSRRPAGPGPAPSRPAPPAPGRPGDADSARGAAERARRAQAAHEAERAAATARTALAEAEAAAAARHRELEAAQRAFRAARAHARRLAAALAGAERQARALAARARRAGPAPRDPG